VPKPTVGDRVSMSSFRIEGLRDLEIHDKNLRYRGHLIGFDAIRSVRFTATEIQHSVNFIPTGSTFTSELYLILESGELVQIHQERALRGKTQKRKMEAVWQAGEIISIATFSRRVQRYEQELAGKGFFQVGQYQITSDGGLFKNRERLFGLRDADVKLSLGPFQLYAQRARHGLGRLLRAQQYVIGIDTDRDCVLYVLKHSLGISFQGAHVREKKVDRRHVFLSAILRLGAKLAKADGRVSREEIRAFKQVFKIDEATVPDAARIFEEAVGSSQEIEDIAGEVFSLVGDNRKLLEYAVLGLMQVATADGMFHEAEVRLIRRICNAFGFQDEETLAWFAMFGVGRFEDEEEEPAVPPRGRGRWSGNGLAEIHLRVLGLGPSSSVEEIKIAYRRLAREHHPDALRAKGVPIDAMRHSEEILKKINEAYAYLTHDR
jgi:DnaJ like chaperone protein